MANSNGWGDGSANNNIGWGQGAVNNNISWGKSQITSWSGATDIDGGNPPVNSVAPALSGTAQEGQTLTCSTGTWSGTPTYTYQWKRNGSNIGSATNSTYTLVTADVGQSILCTVTATNGAGSVNADSNTVTPTSSVDADAQAFITAASITDPTQQSAIITLVTDLKGYNIWTKFKAIYPIVGGSASSHAVNLKTPGTFNLTFATGWTHSATGMTPLNTFANTSLIENTSLNTNDSHISIYSRTNTSVGVLCDIGAATGSTQSNIFPNLGGVFYPRIQASNSGTSVNLDTRGLFMANRVNSTQVQGWRNTTKYTISSNSTGKVTVPFWLADLNNNGVSGGVQSTRQLAFASIGDGLTDTEAANFYTAVNAYQVALSRNV